MGQCINQWQQHLSWSQAALLLCFILLLLSFVISVVGFAITSVRWLILDVRRWQEKKP